MGVQFSDRGDAGRQLGERLGHLRGGDVVVLGLPRGGVVVAAEVAAVLDAPLDVILVRKLGVPQQPELAMGAIGEGGVRVLNNRIMRLSGVGESELMAVERRERAELERRSAAYRVAHPPLPLAGKTVVIVDDGIATGSTALAACRVARAHGAIRVVVAIPVAPAGWRDGLGKSADEFVAVATPARFHAIGEFYADFRQTTDAEVLAALAR